MLDIYFNVGPITIATVVKRPEKYAREHTDFGVQVSLGKMFHLYFRIWESDRARRFRRGRPRTTREILSVG